MSHAATRLLTMTKPVYQAIMRHSPRKPVIVFTPTRKQARITAVDLVTARCVCLRTRWLEITREELLHAKMCGLI